MKMALHGCCITSKGSFNNAEVKKNKDGDIIVLEVRKKIKKKIEGS